LSSSVFSVAFVAVPAQDLEVLLQRMLGVEAYYGGTGATMRALMVKLTRDAGMIPTGGSDYHGLYKESVKLGFGASGDLRVPDEVLDELKAASSANSTKAVLEEPVGYSGPA
jgi:hypothetical protein